MHHCPQNPGKFSRLSAYVARRIHPVDLHQAQQNYHNKKAKKKGTRYLFWLPYNFHGGPKGTRTPVFGVRGRRPRPLDDGTVCSRPKKHKKCDHTCQAQTMPLSLVFKGLLDRRKEGKVRVRKKEAGYVIIHETGIVSKVKVGHHLGHLFHFLELWPRYGRNLRPHEG